MYLSELITNAAEKNHTAVFMWPYQAPKALRFFSVPCTGVNQTAHMRSPREKAPTFGQSSAVELQQSLRACRIVARSTRDCRLRPICVAKTTLIFPTPVRNLPWRYASLFSYRNVTHVVAVLGENSGGSVCFQRTDAVELKPAAASL